MRTRHLLGVTTVRRRYTTLNGTLRFHWTGERTLSGKPTIYEHRWEQVLHRINGETHDFEGFGVPRWGRRELGIGTDSVGRPLDVGWALLWPCLECHRWESVPARHVHAWPHR